MDSISTNLVLNELYLFLTSIKSARLPWISISIIINGDLSRGYSYIFIGM